MPKKRVIIYTGKFLDREYLKGVKGNDYVIGVDRSCYWLLKNGIFPKVAIGDFDSVSNRQLFSIKKKIKKVIIHPSIKNKTDTELAVDYAISQNPSEIIIFGATGSRIDHMLSNIFLLERIGEEKILGKIIDNNNELFLLNGEFLGKNDKNFNYISVLPLSDTATLTLKGLKFEGENLILKRSESRGVSNEVVGNRYIINVIKGKVLVVLSRD